MFHNCKNQSFDLKYMSFYGKRKINASKKKKKKKNQAISFEKEI